MRSILPLLALLPLLLLAACDRQATEAPAAPFARGDAGPLASIQTAKIDLPADDANFGEGHHADLLNRNCLACHSASMVQYQPRLSRKQWTATVEKMREAYGAPIAPEQTSAIVDALMAKAPARP